MQYHLEIFCNVWDFQRTLRLELWTGEPFGPGQILKGYDILCPDEWLEKYVPHVHMSGRYAIPALLLPADVQGAISDRIGEMLREFPGLEV